MRRLLILGVVTALATALVASAASAAPPAMVDVCHFNSLGEWQVNTLRDVGRAVQAHLDHGDGLPGDPVPGMADYEFDADCQPMLVAVPEADLSISKSDDVDPVAPGDTIVYTMTVHNAGPDDATNVVVTDTLPAGVTLVSTSGCVEDPNAVPTCTLGTIAPGGTVQYTVAVTVDAGPSGTITNSVSVASDLADPNTGNNSTSENTTVQNPETIFAVAYTDIVDDGGAYDPAVDVLIAKLVDGPVASPDGVIGVGDIVVTDRYPKAYDGSLFGNFLVNTHTVTGVITPTSFELFVFAGDDLFRWNDGPPFDQYVEDVDDFTTFFVDVHFDPGAGSEQLIADPGSPSSPNEPSVFVNNRPGQETDDAFIDVEITLP